MTTIFNTTLLPKEWLRWFCVTESQAQQIATEYQVSWYMPIKNHSTGYLYVLASEWEAKQVKS